MISASHNPVADNGIKFCRDGFKLIDSVEDEIESLMKETAQGIKTSFWSQEDGLPRPTGKDVGRVRLGPMGLMRTLVFLGRWTERI